MDEKRAGRPHKGHPTTRAHLGHPALNVYLCRGRSPGSRVWASIPLPGVWPVDFGSGSPLTVAGGAAALTLTRSHRIPSSPQAFGLTTRTVPSFSRHAAVSI